jgi:AcrR family transcriptional regulator
MPSPPTDLQPIILARAADLFREHGFAATTVKQIAQAAGCTNAALYYYFPQGKSQIMHEVVQRSLQGVDQVVDAVGSAADFDEFMARLGRIVGSTLPGVARDLGWLMTEFPRLPSEDQQFVQGQIFTLHRAVASGVSRFTPTPERATVLAWLVVCAFFGYELLFLTMGINADHAPTVHEFASVVAGVMTRAL